MKPEVVAKRFFDTFGWLAFVAVVGLVIAVPVGFVLNAYKLAQMCCDMSGLFVLRALGVVFAPLGVVLGYF
jgi:ABC-type transporter Mla maintaining outer membrane lipid asymmetry permease subunit MlaE